MDDNEKRAQGGRETHVAPGRLIAIVVPVYCEAGNLPRLYERLEVVIRQLPQYCWEYVFINDGSPDDSMQVLRGLAQLDKRIKVIDFSRNFGKEIALTAGVQATYADAVITMDADLQHPPELIPQLVSEWEKGTEVVATIRNSIQRQPLLRRIGSHVYYWVMARISGLEMASQTTDFRLLDQRVVEAFRDVTERERMFRGVIDWMGFRKVYVEFDAPAREQGSAGYSYGKLWHLALNSITSFSLLPLRLTGFLGLFITASSGLLLVWMLIANYVLGLRMFTPLAIVMVSNTFLIGIVLMAIGLVALYIGTIHTEVINRPLYVIREKINFDDPSLR